MQECCPQTSAISHRKVPLANTEVHFGPKREGHRMQDVYVFDNAAHSEANGWLFGIKRSTEKEPLSQLFDKLNRESTVQDVATLRLA